MVRLTLKGPDAGPGRIPVADVARLLQGYERALATAAEARVRRVARTGRRGGAVETATRIIFRGISSGSLVAELELPDLIHDEALGLDDDHLGEIAAETVMSLVQNPDLPIDDRVVRALAQLGDELGIGTRYSELHVELERSGAAAPQAATFNAETRRRLNERRVESAQRTAREDRVTGILVEADFETNTAHVRTSDNDRIEVSFSQDLADEIQAALRRPAELEGRVAYDTLTGAVVSVELRSMAQPQQLQALPDAEDFWNHRSVGDLAAEQGVRAVDDPDELATTGGADEEIDAFLDALAR